MRRQNGNYGKVILGIVVVVILGISVFYLTNKNTAQKTLNFNNGQYSLSGQKNQHNYAEMCGLNETFVLARSDKYFSIIKVQ